jgi:hypothetical protein
MDASQPATRHGPSSTIGYDMPWLHGGDCRYGADIGLSLRESGWLAERGLSC